MASVEESDLLLIGSRHSADTLRLQKFLTRNAHFQPGVPSSWPAGRPLETSCPGVFAAGDVRANSTKRVASAVGEGSVVVQYVHRLLS